MTLNSGEVKLEKIQEYIRQYGDGYFISGKYNSLVSLVDEFLDDKTNTANLDTQENTYKLSMSNFTLFAILIERDLNQLPNELRYSLISSAFYSSGIVQTPDAFSETVEAWVDEYSVDWYQEDDIGYRIFNLRDSILRNPTLDKEVLVDEFNSSGDISNLVSILENPSCPKDLKEQIKNKEHFIFDERDDDELEELVEAANS